MDTDSDVGVPNSESEIQSLVPATSTPSAGEIQILTSLAATLSKSGLATAKRPPEQILAIALLGRELGVPVLASLQGIHLIQGQPSLSANLTASLLARGGVRWDVIQNTATQATVLFHRRGWKGIESSFTMDEAKLAGLTGKDIWRKYPADMLWSRAFTRGARKIGPDLLAGFGGYTPDELGGEDHDPDFAPSPSVSPPATTAEAPRNVESTVVSPDTKASAPPVNDEREARESASEEVPPHLIERIDNMLVMNGQLKPPLLNTDAGKCIARLRKYREDGDTWDAVEQKLEAGIEKVSEALRLQIERGMDAESS